MGALASRREKRRRWVGWGRRGARGFGAGLERTLRYSHFFPVSSATPRGENTGRRTSSIVSVSSPVSVFTMASPLPSLRVVTFGILDAASSLSASRLSRLLKNGGG